MSLTQAQLQKMMEEAPRIPRDPLMPVWAMWFSNKLRLIPWERRKLILAAARNDISNSELKDDAIYKIRLVRGDERYGQAWKGFSDEDLEFAEKMTAFFKETCEKPQESYGHFYEYEIQWAEAFGDKKPV